MSSRNETCYGSRGGEHMRNKNCRGRGQPRRNNSNERYRRDSPDDSMADGNPTNAVHGRNGVAKSDNRLRSGNAPLHSSMVNISESWKFAGGTHQYAKSGIFTGKPSIRRTFEGSRLNPVQNDSSHKYEGAHGDNGDSDGDSSAKKTSFNPLLILSKSLASILRHNAENYGLTLMTGGYLYVDDILRSVKKLRRFTVADVEQIVANDDKGRFTLEKDNCWRGRLKIRANLGHSLMVTDLDLVAITSVVEAPVVIHGTFYKYWKKIKMMGLMKMNRNYILFAERKPDTNENIPGMKNQSEVLIYINMVKALTDGLRFFRSKDGVIHCPGNVDGIIHPCYFTKVLDKKKNFKLAFNQSIKPSLDASVTGETSYQKSSMDEEINTEYEAKITVFGSENSSKLEQSIRDNIMFDMQQASDCHDVPSKPISINVEELASDTAEELLENPVQFNAKCEIDETTSKATDAHNNIQENNVGKGMKMLNLL